MKIIEIRNEDLYQNQKAYNPSIIECYGKTYMLYRLETPHGDFNTSLGISELDDQFNPIYNSGSLLNVTRFSSRNTTFDDPRAFVMNGDLYFAYCAGGLIPVNAGTIWCNHIAIARWKNGRIDGQWLPDYAKNINITSNDVIKKPTGNGLFQEKNWSPFIHKGKIRFTYKLNPLEIIEFDFATNECRQIGEKTKFPQKFWDRYGKFIGGGTGFIRKEDEYIGFFHSFTDNMKGKPTSRTYNFGFIAFSAKEPHIVTRISSKPIMIAKMDPKNDTRGNFMWRPSVVYPCGFIERNGKVYVSYGYHDCLCRIVELSWKEIEKDVIAVKPE